MSANGEEDSDTNFHFSSMSAALTNNIQSGRAISHFKRFLSRENLDIPDVEEYQKCMAVKQPKMNKYEAA